MRLHRSTALLAVFAVLAVLILFTSTTNQQRGLIPSTTTSLRNHRHKADPRDHRRRQLEAISLAQFSDPKSVTSRINAGIGQVATSDGKLSRQPFPFINHDSRNNCQIIYIVGVEGATHHGFLPIIETLARKQIDPATGLEYHVDASPSALKAGLFGWFSGQVKRWGFDNTPEIDDPAFVRKVLEESCPNDGKKHVLIEWASFPSGHLDDKRSYRVHRQKEWLSMTPEEIANDAEAQTHPFNLPAFYRAYSPFADIKFVVLHRPFLETIASHADWDEGPIIHSNIIRGFMLVIRRFLDSHTIDWVTGGRLWAVVCADRIMTKNYGPEEDVRVARQNIISYLADFLNWPDGVCPHCFDEWYESKKDPFEVLGTENVKILLDHMKLLVGVWPPPGEEGFTEQQCGM